MCHLAEVRVAESVADRALAGTTGSGSRRVDAILRVVKAIERFHPELEAHPFRKLERLAQADVPVIDSRLSQRITSDVAVNPETRLGKGRAY